jgi:hypothetical protein
MGQNSPMAIEAALTEISQFLCTSARESPAALKYVLCLLGYMSPATRLPLVELDDLATGAIAGIGDEDIACPVGSGETPRLGSDAAVMP